MIAALPATVAVAVIAAPLAVVAWEVVVKPVRDVLRRRTAASEPVRSTPSDRWRSTERIVGLDRLYRHLADWNTRSSDPHAAFAMAAVRACLKASEESMTLGSGFMLSVAVHRTLGAVLFVDTATGPPCMIFPVCLHPSLEEWVVISGIDDDNHPILHSVRHRSAIEAAQSVLT